jgi:hypothetical protein
MAKGYQGYMPGFLPKDQIIWTNFLDSHPEIPADIDYNVRVGKGFDPGPNWEPSARQAAIANSQLRLDAVVEWQGAWWIFEVKPRCGASAVGQLLQYEVLYEESYPNNRPIKLAIVTAQPKLGLQTLCTRYHVTLYVQPM